MPTEEENVQYLYLVLTHGGNPVIDWDAVGATMELKKGAVSKRWSRLNKAMDNGEKPGGSAYQFLWLCVKHSVSDKATNWNEIADACGTTAGAASKRYSRMKQAFEAGVAPPGSNSGSSVPKTPVKSTPRKNETTAATDEDGEGTPTPKRKRATPRKKASGEDEVHIKRDLEEEEQSPKKAKITKPKATRKRKANGKANVKQDANVPIPTTEATTTVKMESTDDDNDFVDAEEWFKDLVDDEEEHQANRVNEWLQESV